MTKFKKLWNRPLHILKKAMWVGGSGGNHWISKPFFLCFLNKNHVFLQFTCVSVPFREWHATTPWQCIDWYWGRELAHLPPWRVYKDEEENQFGIKGEDDPVGEEDDHVWVDRIIPHLNSGEEDEYIGIGIKERQVYAVQFIVILVSTVHNTFSQGNPEPQIACPHYWWQPPTPPCCEAMQK